MQPTGPALCSKFPGEWLDFLKIEASVWAAAAMRKRATAVKAFPHIKLVKLASLTHEKGGSPSVESFVKQHFLIIIDRLIVSIAA